MDQEQIDLIAKATAAVQAAIPNASADPSRPSFHFLPAAQWMNDPNGTIYHQGWYHLFYQFNPYGDQWGNMHWGHARSRDMVHWEDLPIALAPVKSKGEDHVFSGSTFLDNAGKPVIQYTSIGSRAPEQWAATPLDADLIRWRRVPENPVVSIKTHAPLDIAEWRDPFLFKENGQTYMLTGGNIKGQGIVALHRAKNDRLTAWEYVGILFKDPNVNNIECPNFVKLGRKWVLLVSVKGRVEWHSGDLQKDLTFKAEKTGVLAEGSYASQLLTDKDGRCIHFAWVNTMNRKGWNGCMTLPSILTLAKDGSVLRKPIPALTKLRDQKKTVRNQEVNGHLDLTAQIPSDRFELIAEIEPGNAKTITLRLLASEDESRAVTVTYDCQARQITQPRQTPLKTLKLHLFLDGSILDFYGDNGAATFCSVIQPKPEDRKASLTAVGGTAKLKSFTVYGLRNANASPPK